MLRQKWRYTRLIDVSRTLMECAKCGKRWGANLKPGGDYYKGAWKCPNGCSDEPTEKK